jgi:glycosyltransferase involved in cell wall biosynthesis
VSKPRLIIIGPLPPPHHGVTISTSLVLANARLDELFDVTHLDTSDRRSRENIGTWDVQNVALGLRNVAELARSLRGTAGLVYLPISQGIGFLRDSLFIYLARARGWEVAVHLRGSEFGDFYRAGNPLMRLWIRRAMHHVSSVGVMGESLRGVFGDLVPDDRIAVVPNGTPDPGPNGTVRDSATVLFLSHLRRRKGVAESVDAALNVLAQKPDVRFLFVGEWEDPDLERELRRRAASAGDAIRFLPAVIGEDKRNLLSSCSVFLFPPVEPEGHPRALLEAIAAGLPVVTTARGAIAETVVNGESGFVLDDPNPTELAQYLLRLLRDGELRRRMSEAARARYLERFTQEEADLRLAEWLQDVATARRSRVAHGRSRHTTGARS